MDLFQEPGGEGGTCRLSLTGELDLAVTEGLVDKVRACVADAETVELDLSGVSFIDSSGLGALVLLQKDASERGRKLVLVNPGTAFTRLLRITGLQDTFDVLQPGQ